LAGGLARPVVPLWAGRAGALLAERAGRVDAAGRAGRSVARFTPDLASLGLVAEGSRRGVPAAGADGPDLGGRALRVPVARLAGRDDRLSVPGLVGRKVLLIVPPPGTAD